jgi:hypothetical protein
MQRRLVGEVGFINVYVSIVYVAFLRWMYRTKMSNVEAVCGGQGPWGELVAATALG